MPKKMQPGNPKTKRARTFLLVLLAGLIEPLNAHGFYFDYRIVLVVALVIPFLFITYALSFLFNKLLKKKMKEPLALAIILAIACAIPIILAVYLFYAGQ